MEEEGENGELVSAYKLDDLNSSIVFFNWLKMSFWIFTIQPFRYVWPSIQSQGTRIDTVLFLAKPKTQSYRCEFVRIPLLGVIVGCSDGLY